MYGSIPYRDEASGTFSVNFPTQDLEVANKAYVDYIAGVKLDKVTTPGNAERAYIISADGTSQTVRDVSQGASAWSIARRGQNGTLEVGTPTGNTHAVNLKYFNAKVPKLSLTLKENGAYTLSITTPEAEV